MAGGLRERWRLLGPLSGIVSVALVFVGGAAIAGTSGAGRHSLDASTEEVAEFVAGTSDGRVWVGEYVGLLGFALFLVFAAFVRDLLADGDARPRAGGGILTSAASLFVALTAAGIAALAPALNREIDGATAAAFLDLRTVLLSLGFVFLAVWLLAAGLLAVRGETFPGWLAWGAVAIGLLGLAMAPLAAFDPGFTGIPTFASFIWILVASAVLLRRERSRPAR